MRKFLKYFISMPFMVFLFLLYAVAMAVATFIENDYGAEISRHLVYNAWWFELIQFMLVVNMIGNIFIYKLYTKEKFSILLFHIAFIVILLGAGFTRYLGYEGLMHIRENESTNQFFSDKSYMQVRNINDKENLLVDDAIFISPYIKSDYSTSFDAKGTAYSLELLQVMPNAQRKLSPSKNGKPIIEIIFSDKKTFSNYFITQGSDNSVFNFNFSLNENKNEKANIHFNIEQNKLFIQAKDSLEILNRQGVPDTLLSPNTNYEVSANKICVMNGKTFFIKGFYDKGKITYSPGDVSKGILSNTLEMKVSDQNNSELVYLEFAKRTKSEPQEITLGANTFLIEYGIKELQLPFEIKLRDFQLDRYPGSMSPSSFASEVTLIDKANNHTEDSRIFMNNILQYQGFRFYQSSYDSDELGTILEVNHDTLGTDVTYIGYLLLLIGIIWSMIQKKSFLAELSRRTSAIRAKRNSISVVIALFLIFGSLNSYSQTAKKQHYDEKHAELFGKLLVQDPGGRIKPIQTMSNEILRKLSRSETWDGFNSNQVFMGMLFNSNYWKTVKMIKVGNPAIMEKYGLEGKFVCFNDLINKEKGTYLLKDEVEAAFAKPPSKQSKYDKEIINVDERLNIAYQIYTWQYLRVFPVPENAHASWLTPFEARSLKDSLNFGFAKTAFSSYYTEVSKAWADNNWSAATKVLESIQNYQKKYAAEILPSESKLSMEILYYKLNIFKRVFMYYGLIGFLFLIFLFVGILKPKFQLRKVTIVFTVLLAILFAFHSLGLGMRWYISGHAPFSNGYESMIYIGWAIMLAGFIFVKKSTITLATTAILASITLMVAHLSWMNPEITNLVPVLKSYWLTIHVSVITASYGFLALGSIIGLLNLLLIIFTNKKNLEKLNLTISELSNVNHMTLIIGVYLLTIGTFLGAVWANESWGRYWGWDPKETWALISVIVYSFVLHTRFIPSLNNKFFFNFFALIGFSSILMTYLGVNYYLSGLHSYAHGDPIPIPNWVYYSIFIISSISIVAFLKSRKLKFENVEDE